MAIWTNDERAYGKQNLGQYKANIGEDTAAALEQFKAVFYDKYKRVIRCDDETILTVAASATFDETEKTDQWFLDRLIEADEEYLAAKMKQERHGKQSEDSVSISALIDKVNGDAELQAFVGKVAEVKDLPAKAPATVAFRIQQDMSGKERRSFAIPYSDESKSTDGDKNKLGDNERAMFAGKWDNYDHKVMGQQVKGSWFLDFVDGTSSGIVVKSLIDSVNPDATHDGKDNVPIVIDGRPMDAKALDKTQRKAFYEMLGQRRRAMAECYRKAIQVLNKWDELEDKYGNTYNEDGTVKDIGVLMVDWVWLDPQNPDKGIAPTKSPIRITPIIQSDIKVKDKEGNEVVKVKAGTLSSGYVDMPVSRFLNLSIDAAIQKAAKAGKDKPMFVDIIESKKVKAAPVTADTGKEPESKKEDKLKISVNTMPDILRNFRLFSENAGLLTAWKQRFNNLPADQQRDAAYDAVELMNWLDNFCSDPIVKLHDKVAADMRDKEDKELAEKLARAGNADE